MYMYIHIYDYICNYISSCFLLHLIHSYFILFYLLISYYTVLYLIISHSALILGSHQPGSPGSVGGFFDGHPLVNWRHDARTTTWKASEFG